MKTDDAIDINQHKNMTFNHASKVDAKSKLTKAME